MNAKLIFKISIDFFMTVMLLILMAYQLTGQFAHEWIGAGMFILFIIHNILNLNWYLNIFKGRYTPLRIFQSVINFLVFFSMIGLMVSSVILSRYVFEFLSVTGGSSFGRTLHMLAAYWGFVLTSIHLGLHWNMLMGIARKVLKPAPSRPRVFTLRFIGALIAAYGLYSFVNNQIGMYMFLRVQFTFFDFERPAVLFFADYLAMMELFVFLAYYGAKLIQTCPKRKGLKKNELHNV